MKKIIKAARRENYIEASQLEFLFEDIKISAKRTTKRIYLETDEIKKLKALNFSEEKKFLERSGISSYSRFTQVTTTKTSKYLKKSN